MCEREHPLIHLRRPLRAEGTRRSPFRLQTCQRLGTVAIFLGEDTEEPHRRLLWSPMGSWRRNASCVLFVALGCIAFAANHLSYYAGRSEPSSAPAPQASLLPSGGGGVGGAHGGSQPRKQPTDTWQKQRHTGTTKRVAIPGVARRQAGREKGHAPRAEGVEDRVLRLQDGKKEDAVVQPVPVVNESTEGKKDDAAAENRTQSMSGGAAIVRNFARKWSRGQLGTLLSELKVKSAAELGVKQGQFAEQTLRLCKTCKKYILVDLWKQQKNYKDVANVPDSQHAAFKSQALGRLQQFKSRGVNVQPLQMSTLEAAKHVPDGSLDFIYVDARHDYCGVQEDLIAWWPKLNPAGSVMAGHDFLFANASQLGGQDWSLCGDGRRNVGAVKGAVLEFFEGRPNVLGPFASHEHWLSWMYYIGPDAQAGAS